MNKRDFFGSFWLSAYILRRSSEFRFSDAIFRANSSKEAWERSSNISLNQNTSTHVRLRKSESRIARLHFVCGLNRVLQMVRFLSHDVNGTKYTAEVSVSYCRQQSCKWCSVNYLTVGRPIGSPRVEKVCKRLKKKYKKHGIELRSRVQIRRVIRF